MSEENEIPQGLVATQFRFQSDISDHNPDAVVFDRMDSPFYKGPKWAVRQSNQVLSTSVVWEYEPIPSSRDDAFYKRCRFDSMRGAFEALKKSLLGTEPPQSLEYG